MYDASFTDVQNYQKDEQLLSGVAFFGPNGTIFFDETARSHEREYVYEDGTRTAYRHEDKKSEFSTDRDKYTEYY